MHSLGWSKSDELEQHLVQFVTILKQNMFILEIDIITRTPMTQKSTVA